MQELDPQYACTWDDVEGLVTKMRKEWKVLSICDIVLNHASNGSGMTGIFLIVGIHFLTIPRDLNNRHPATRIAFFKQYSEDLNTDIPGIFGYQPFACPIS